MKFEYFSMPLPNQTVKNKETIMSTKPNTNLKPIELTSAELNSVAGGGGPNIFVIKKVPAKLTHTTPPKFGG
jgi:hypothetical protein